MDPSFVMNFQKREGFEKLIEIRNLIQKELSSAEVRSHMRNDGDIKGLDIVF